MDNNEELSDLIDRYLSDDLQNDELNNFRERMEISQAVKDEVDLQKEIKEALLEKDIMGFREVVKEAISENKKTVQPINQRIYFKIAASISLLFVFSFYIYNSFFNTRSSEEVFELYFKPYDNLTTVRNDKMITSDIQKAMEYYDKFEYRKAINHFIKTDYKNSGLTKLYLGISYTSLNILDSAHLVLQVSANSSDKLYYYPTLYYKGLIYLKKNDAKNAKLIFSELLESNSNPYSNYAKEILEQLD